MARLLRYAGQAAIYAVIAAVLGYFSFSPAYRHFPRDEALVLLAFAHGAKHKGECRTLTTKEISELAPNMRRAKVCPRERLSVLVEVAIDGELIYRKELPPTGLQGDGPSRIYQGFPVPAGRHTVAVRLRDSAREAGFDYEREEEVDLPPARKLVIDFRPDTGGLLFR